MKHACHILLFLFLPFLISAQSLTPKVFGSAGGLMESSNGSLSTTFGESVTGTITDGNYVLTQGFQQPINVVLEGLIFDFLVFLEGPHSVDAMNNLLSTTEKIPLNQPYFVPPWNYAGNESVEYLPNANIVDWLLIEIRQAGDAQNATASTVVSKQAAFLLKNGSIVGLDGLSPLKFNLVPNNLLFAVIWHRNHLGIMSANALSLVGGLYTYDFTNDINQVYGGSFGYKIGNSGECVMVAGDGNRDGLINNLDKNLWSTEAGHLGYPWSDYNMDAQVDNKDRSDLWLINQDYSSQVPK